MSTPATRRVNRGRGHSYLLDGAPADGVTWILNKGVAKPALVAWAARESAGYAVDNWAELTQLGLAERIRKIEAARFETLKGASVRGTDVHQLAQRLAAGETVDVPDHLEGHVDAYLQFVNDWQPQELLTEVVVGNRKHRYMGTLDTIARLAGNHIWILDWKTSKSGIWSESALQLAAYRNADFYLDHQGQEQPMPHVDRAGCVWLRADGYDLTPVNTEAKTFRTFLYAQQMARFADTPRDSYVQDALTPLEEVA